MTCRLERDDQHPKLDGADIHDRAPEPDDDDEPRFVARDVSRARTHGHTTTGHGGVLGCL